MPKRSAGLLFYRTKGAATEVFLVHPGGPFWKNKDAGAWSIPKGEFEDDEEPLEAAKREFREETGRPASGEFAPLQPVRQPGGKVVYAWAQESDFDAGAVKSNLFSMEWPRGSGRMAEFPEIDRASWFPIETAKRKILKGQVPLLDQLLGGLSEDFIGPSGRKPSK
jgi:predicted NUDIX family NTP pyrophosphohydrolase